MPKSTSSKPGAYRAWFWDGAQSILNVRICDLGTGVVASPTRLDFGSQVVNTLSRKRTIAVTLTKGGPRAVGQVALSGANSKEFAVVSNSCTGKTLPPSCSILVTFQPAGIGMRSASLGIADGQGTNLQSTQLVGQGREPFSAIPLQIGGGGAESAATLNSPGTLETGYAAATVNSGVLPYGTAVFSFRQNEAIVSEAGVPASPPTNSARIFIDYRTAVPAVPGRIEAGTIDINTGIALVNYGAVGANVTYTLRDMLGTTLSIGHGTFPAGTHFAKFINQLTDVAPDFRLPAGFQLNFQFGSLEISSDQPVSVLALRMTTNQRGEALFTTTPVADLTKSLTNGPAYFPQFADGGGYTTSLILLNTSNAIETGSLQFLDDNGSPLTVNQVGGSAAGSSFNYSIRPGGAARFQTDGSPAATKVGWACLTPGAGTSTPIGAGVFSYNPGNFLITESGVAATDATTHARIYVDLSGGHNAGLAIANPGSTNAAITIKAFQSDGVSGIGTSQGPLLLLGSGHKAKFAGEFVTGLPAEFTGVLDISSSTPFAALTLRSLNNERNDFLLTTFPIADANRYPPSPIIFPHIADGGGYATQFILLSPNGVSRTTLNFYRENGTSLTVGK